MAPLLENLRAELAGETGKDCKKLFSDCSNESLIEEKLGKLREVLSKDNKFEVYSKKIEEEINDNSPTRWEVVSISRFSPTGDIHNSNFKMKGVVEK